MKKIFARFGAIKTIKNPLRLFVLPVLLFSMLFASRTPAQTAPRINEFMALNQTVLADADGNFSDWIEIYNPTAQTVELQGWFLTDDKGDHQKWQFPQTSIAAGGYVVIFASGKDKNAAGELHTNFKLNGSGEYLALVSPDESTLYDFDPSFPQQHPDISFGFLDDDWVHSSAPTPGEENQQSENQLLPDPQFSKTRGFYETPFTVELSSGLQNAALHYTTDGSDPTENSTVYAAPIPISTTTVLRAVTIKSQMSSRAVTQSYLFIEDVIRQSNNPPGYPSTWGPYTGINGTAIADYEMDPAITENAAYRDQMKEALLSIPTLSIVTDKDNLFSKSKDPDKGGIYIYTGPPLTNSTDGLGDGWERPTSVEFFDASGEQEFQVNCGIRLQGGHSRRPEKSPKHSFRLIFRSTYGPSKLDFPLFGKTAATSFNSLALRAGFCNTWHHHAWDQRKRAQYIRDTWAKDTMMDMGHLAGHGTFVHLYLNGLYWGVYNPTERMEDDFAASYLEGDEEDFDVIKDYANVVDGTKSAWNDMMRQARAGLSSDAAYQRIQGNNPDGTPNPEYDALVDVENLIDYMLLNFYGANTDWDHHNWAAVRNRVNPGKGFQFQSWDAEHILENVNSNFLDENNSNCPSDLFQRLRQNADFRRLVADRVQRHCFNGGALTPQAAIERWEKRADEVELAVIAESARWGDYRRDVHKFQTAGPFYLYAPQTYWHVEKNRLLTDYFPKRTDIFVNHLRNTNLFPNVSSPVFKINGESVSGLEISPGDKLSMTTARGDIYYTTDGTDPLAPANTQNAKKTLLFAQDADKRVMVPKSDIGSSWRSDINYDDSAWSLCSGAPGGIGYEKSSGYEDWITLNVATEMRDGSAPNPSCYIRIPFHLTKEQLAAIKSLTLNIAYDDGFVAWLNGHDAADANAPDDTPRYNSTAEENHEADAPEAIDLSGVIKYLVEGDNVLAIQGLNTNTTSSDFIILTELSASDKVQSGGTVSPSAVVYSAPIVLNQSTQIKARSLSGAVWSALNSAVFVLPQDLQTLKLTEIHYHPSVQDSTMNDRAFEFIELKNIGTTALHLGGVSFSRGISYTFPMETILGPQEFIVLASDPLYFHERYNTAPFAHYEGYLNNAGERIVLIDAAEDTLISLRYNDKAPWPTQADGDGYSLVTKDANPHDDQSDPNSWRISYAQHGSPGVDDSASTTVKQEADAVPQRFQLEQNYPNPFNNGTVISFQLPRDAQVKLTIFDIVGRTVKTFSSEERAAGFHHIFWNGRNDDERPVSSGVYFYRMSVDGAEHFVQTKKMILMK